MPKGLAKRPVVIDPYGLDRILADFVYMPLHAQGSATGKIVRYSNIDALNTELTLPAGTADYTTNRGRLTADGSLYVADKTQDFADFATWWVDTTTPQQMFMLFDLNFGAGTPANNYVFSMSAAVTGGAYGGYGLMATNGTNLIPKINNAGTVTDVGGIQAAAGSTEYRYCLLWDAPGLLLHHYRNATGGTAKPLAVLPSAISAAYGCSFLGRSTTTSPGNLFRSGDRMGNIFMLKPRYDISGDMAAIAADFQKYPNKIGVIARDL